MYFLYMLVHVFLKVVQSLKPCLFLVIFYQSDFMALFLNFLISEILMDQQIHSGVSVEYLHSLNEFDHERKLLSFAEIVSLMGSV